MRAVVVMILMIFLPFCAKAEDTALKLFRPYVEEGRTIVKVSTIIKQAFCSGQSQRIKREDAWRCMANGQVYDPCFVRKFSDNREALCVASPWAADGIMLQVSTPLDNSHHVSLDLSTAYPWAVELATGEHCEAIDKGEQFDGLPVRYRCDNQAILMGHLQRCKAPWSILQRHSQGTVETAEVKTAWF